MRPDPPVFFFFTSNGKGPNFDFSVVAPVAFEYNARFKPTPQSHCDAPNPVDFWGVFLGDDIIEVALMKARRAYEDRPVENIEPAPICGHQPLACINASFCPMLARYFVKGGLRFFAAGPELAHVF